MITDAHRKFARAVVALAREHGMNHMSLSFDMSSSEMFLNRPESYSWGQVTMNWKEGRHGDTAPIKIELHEQQDVREKIDP